MKRRDMHFGVILLSIIGMMLTSSVTIANEQWDKAKFFLERLQSVPLPPGLTDDPPPQIPFAVAEWEPATGCLITYPLHIPIDLVAELAEDCEVWSVVPDRTYEVAALEEYAAGGVDTSKCHFIHMGAFTTPWTRDHGPWYIFDGNDELGIIDNIYGGSSELVPQVLGDTLGIPVYATGITTEGGNYMTDGMGRAIVTKWIHLENPQMTKDQIDRIMTGYLGFEDHMVRPITPAFFHIDTFAKLLDPGRILVIQPDPPVPSIEANVEYWSTIMSAYGRPYDIIRVQGRGYSNTLILNDKVLVPLFNDPTDSAALATFQEAMPGYEVYGYRYHGLSGFSYGDALHCRTHEMHDRYMLRIVHVPVHDCENTGGGYYLEADIHPHSNEPLVGPPVIMWRVEGGNYSPVAMTFAGDDIYYGEIPQQPDGTDIYYYLEAEDGSGRVEHHPHIGEGNPHHFHVGPDDEAPVVEFDPPTTFSSAQWPVNLTTYALDNRWIESVTLEYSINGVQQVDVDMPLRGQYAVYYTGTTEGTVLPGDLVEVRVKAVDTSVNQNTTYSSWYTINIEPVPDIDIIMELVSIPVVPPGGSTLIYNVMLFNGDTLPLSFDVWLDLTYESNPPVTLIQRYLTSMQPGQVFSRPNMRLPIPPNYPAGMYFLGGRVGEYSDIIWAEDSFPFMKEGSDNLSAFLPWIPEGLSDPFVLLEDKDGTPACQSMVSAYPNPFNPATVISYQLSVNSHVNLSVYDITGRKVAELVNGWRDIGKHEVTFDASELASGVYIYQINTQGFTTFQKILLLK